jgi:hypothetical protein
MLIPVPPPQATPIPIVAPNPRITNETALSRATQLLRRGQNYSEAIRLLREASVAQKTAALPKAYLACALLGRAASLALAEKQSHFFTEDREKYAEMMYEWEREKSIPTSPWYKQPAPKAPILRTWDNDLPYTPVVDQQGAINTLCDEAFDLAKESVQRATSDKERGEMLHLSSWTQVIYYFLCNSPSRKSIPALYGRFLKTCHLC